VNNGIARRAWAGNAGARFAVERAMREEPRLRLTAAALADAELVERAEREAYGRSSDR
jgi:urocanate hydratase